MALLNRSHFVLTALESNLRLAVVSFNDDQGFHTCDRLQQNFETKDQHHEATPLCRFHAMFAHSKLMSGLFASTKPLS